MESISKPSFVLHLLKQLDIGIVWHSSIFRRVYYIHMHLCKLSVVEGSSCWSSAFFLVLQSELQVSVKGICYLLGSNSGSFGRTPIDHGFKPSTCQFVSLGKTYNLHVHLRLKPLWVSFVHSDLSLLLNDIFQKTSKCLCAVFRHTGRKIT